MKGIPVRLSIFAAVAAFALFTLAASAQQQIRTPKQTRLPQNPDFSKLEVQTLKVQGNVYLLTGAGGNIAVQVGDAGVLVVDTGLAEMGDKVIAAIRKLSDKPIQYIVNTHVHPDHTGGNDAVRKAGLTYVGANITGNLTD